MQVGKSFQLYIGLLLLGCSFVVRADEVLVAVASNFSAPMKVLKARFEYDTGHRLKLSFGSSGKLFAQIQHGAPFQVFLSADQDKPETLLESGRAVVGSDFTYATGALALWSAAEGGEPFDIDVLRRADLDHVALANPKLAPYGLAAVQTLQALQLDQTTKQFWVVGENIAQTHQFVSSGNAEYGFVALSQIKQPGKPIIGRYWIVPSNLHSPIHQDAVLLTLGQNSQAAKELLAFLHSKSAQQVIASYGYRIEVRK
ncbi:molybdate ABC transporter substrate-binding protein [Ketobacter alkanivorans]|uniref:Molybdate ABC transporter substrate-binding protein n=1 Tax=Ketobacter alkanivorans TaxID=1917421 RepID=A0A2K9LNM3_9GAMM|nr:molybdate ABC transporter substrate-binding protein [Ketobacter alkanivorans]AUM13969.1 molybdate ABC transporter substrate-binding protein [Ketobacter alkanivorans]